METLRPASWREVLRLCHITAPRGDDAQFTSRLLELLGEAQPIVLVEALTAIAEIGNADGTAVLQELEVAVGTVLPDDFMRNATAQELAARFWCLAQEQVEVAERLSVAQSLLLARRRQRPSLHFAGASPRPAKALKTALPTLRRLLGEVLLQRGAGPYLHIDQLPDDERLLLALIHGATRRAFITVNDAETGRERKEVRPAVTDLVKYDAETGRLELQLASSHLADDLRRVLGIAFFDDSTFFAGEGGWDLSSLQRQRRAVFGRSPLGVVESIALRACVWQPSSGGRMLLSHPDVFQLVERHELAFDDGELIEARFALRIHSDGRARRVGATIRPPNRLACDERYRAEVTKYFGELGLHAGPSTADLWSLGSGAHRESSWRSVLGSASLLDARDAGILVPATITPGEADGLTMADWVDDGPQEIAVDDDGHARRISRADLVGYEIDPNALGRRLARLARLQGTPNAVHPALLELGLAVVGEHHIRVFLAHRDPGVGAGVLRDLLRARDAHRSVVLVPPGRSLEGVHAAPLNEVITPSRLLGRIASAVELASLLPAIETAPDDARLVVDAVTNTAWLGDAELDLTPTQFGFMLDAALATQRKRLVPSKETARTRRPSTVGDRARAKTKSEILKRLREQFARTPGPMPPELAVAGALFVNRGNGWSDTFAPRVWVRPASE